MKNDNRVKKLEDAILTKESDKLWVVVPFGCLYGDKDAEPYWTDEAPCDMSRLYGEPYRKVDHPEGKPAKAGIFG